MAIRVAVRRHSDVSDWRRSIGVTACEYSKNNSLYKFLNKSHGMCQIRSLPSCCQYHQLNVSASNIARKLPTKFLRFDRQLVCTVACWPSVTLTDISRDANYLESKIPMRCILQNHDQMVCFLLFILKFGNPTEALNKYVHSQYVGQDTIGPNKKQ